ncbi:acyl-CoA dehydrogenase family protein [Ammoniphilus resinae]|uniref:Acyl-CoA oxidase/dehydrogenase middle domain-containing protein n=1 Tax=Ammoniphilus resinae TaxID=861532 RepID=A0ABS4GWS3_9BACL|nr:acyl-CoA dehydrogenase family protein [Ammoniphilus resinae]MBP1934725.1 hypothetical protein [Ammoniphilus resinae]
MENQALFRKAEEIAHLFRIYVINHYPKIETSIFLEFWPKLVVCRFDRMLVDAGFGGLGLGLADYLRIIRLLARGDSALALATHIHNVALKTVSEVVKESPGPLQQLVREPKLWALARSEAGRDYRYQFSTEITFNDSEWTLTGQKDFCTLAGLADYYLVFAQTCRESPSLSTIQLCVVDGKDPRLEVLKTNRMDAMVLSSTSSVCFHDYSLHADDLVGEPGDLLKVESPDTLTLGITAIQLGIVDEVLAQFTSKMRNLEPEKRDPERIRWLGEIDIALRGTELLLAESLHHRPGSHADAGLWLRRAKASSDLLVNKATEGAIRYLGREGILSENRFIYLRNNSLAGQVMPPSLSKCLSTLGGHWLDKSN